jgi:hypothetical protein
MRDTLLRDEPQQLLGGQQLLALTAPLILDDTVMLGFHNISGNQDCIEIPEVSIQPFSQDVILS